MNREITPKVKHIINNAMKEAKLNQDSHIKPEHILLALLLEDTNIFVEYIKKLSDNNVIVDEISELLRSNNISTTIQSGKKIRLPFNPDLKKCFMSLDEESEKLGDDYIGLEHVVLSILKFKKLEATKLLSNYNITYETFKIILKSMRNEFDEKELPKNLLGDEPNDMFGDDLDKSKKTNKKGKLGKTPVLDNFCTDISKAAEEGKIDPIIGREKEIKRVSQILSRRKKNNPVIVGEAGVGKCICSDTIVTLRNDITGEVFDIKIDDLLNKIKK